MARETRTHNLEGVKPGTLLYNVNCQSCGMGAIANSLEAAEQMALEHVHFKGDHTVHVAGRNMITQVINLQTLGEMQGWTA